MMRLISFLGTGNYGETTYSFESNTCRTRYVAHALASFTRPNEIRVIATAEAWNQHGDALGRGLSNAGHPVPEQVRVPTGGEPQQLWQMFGTIVEVIRTSGSPVLLDITHGFRMQPFFAAACIQYIQSVLSSPPPIRVVYGEFRGAEQESPIWELTPFLEVLAWSRNLMMFLRTGQADELVEPTKRLGRDLRKQWAATDRSNPQPGLENLGKALEAFSDDFTTIRTGSLLIGKQSSAQRLWDAIGQTRNEVVQHLPALALVLDQVQAMVEQLRTGGARLSSAEGQRALLALARLYQKMGRYSEAISVLREGWITLGAPNNADHPGPDLNRLARENQETIWQQNTTQARSVSALRNDIQHAGFNPETHARSWFERQLTTLLDQWQAAIDSTAGRHPKGMTMLLLNFGHPLTDAQLTRIRELVGRDIERVIDVPTHLDQERAFDEQVRELLMTVPLTREQWQTTPLIVNPPSLAPITAVLLAEIHGRTGYFPTILRLRPAAGSVPPQFEVAELINLQKIRDAARTQRT